MSLVSGISGAGRKARRKATKDQPEVVLGEDWIAPDASVRGELAARQDRRGLISINRSPLARKIISFNMVAILVLVAGILYLNPFRESLVYQRDIGLGVEAELLSEVIAARLPATGSSAQSATLANVFEEFDPPSSSTVLLYDLRANGGKMVAQYDSIMSNGYTHSYDGENTIVMGFAAEEANDIHVEFIDLRMDLIGKKKKKMRRKNMY